jgi:hypothetical protein
MNNSSNANENQPVEEQVHANLFALQEELDNLYAQLSEYEGSYYNRAQARIAEIEGILNRAAQPRNTSSTNTDPNVESEDPKPNANANGNQQGGKRRRKTRKARKASKKTRRTRHKKYAKRR